MTPTFTTGADLFGSWFADVERREPGDAAEGHPQDLGAETGSAHAEDDNATSHLLRSPQQLLPIAT